MNISAPFIRRPIATSLIAAAFLVFGIVGFLNLPVAALPRSGLSDHPGERQPAGREPRDDGVEHRPAARAAVLADPRRHRDDLGELAGLDQHHHSVRAVAQHRPGRGGRADGDQRRQRAAAHQPPVGAAAAQGQPGRRADHDHWSDVRYPAAGDGRRLRRERYQPADLAHRRRGPGVRRRSAKAGRPHPGRSAQGGGARAAARPDPLGHRRSDRQRAEGQHQRPAEELQHLRQRPDPERRAMEGPGGRLPQRRRRHARRNRAGDAERREHPGRRVDVSGRGEHRPQPGPRPGRAADRLQAAGRQRHPDRRPHRQGAAGAGGRHPAGGQRQHPRRPHADHPRLGARRGDHPA